MKIGLLVGSLRKDSFNKKIAEIVQNVIREENDAEIIDISYLPFYNQDDDGDNPREEYNRGVAPALKNVLDIGSRDPEGNLWNEKIAAVFSASMGQSGGMMGNFGLKDSFVFLNLITMNQPEVYISGIHTLFDEEGNLVEDTRVFIENSTRAFLDFAKKHA